MSLSDLDAVLTAPKRLAALAILANSKRAEFAFLQDHLEVLKSDLSKQMSALVAAGYVTVTKTGKGAKRRTWFAATDQGKKAFETHVAALQQIIVDQAPTASN